MAPWGCGKGAGSLHPGGSARPAWLSKTCRVSWPGPHREVTALPPALPRDCMVPRAAPQPGARQRGVTLRTLQTPELRVCVAPAPEAAPVMPARNAAQGRRPSKPMSFKSVGPWPSSTSQASTANGRMIGWELLRQARTHPRPLPTAAPLSLTACCCHMPSKTCWRLQSEATSASAIKHHGYYITNMFETYGTMNFPRQTDLDLHGSE